MQTGPATSGGGRDLRSLPKAHLHLHFTGSMRPSTVIDLATRHGLRLPTTLAEGFRGDLNLSLSPDVRGWFRFQRLYDAARTVVRCEADLRRVVREAAEDDAAEGSRWLELQIDPTSYAPFVGGITPVVEIVLDEAATASARTGTGVGIIIAASRIRHPLDARTLARLAARYAGQGPGTVLGFGLSNDERRGWTADFAPAFTIARNAGLALVPHGGELLGPDHVSFALDWLGPDRLGHGIRSSEDPEVLKRVVDLGVALEVCPASNVALGVYPDLAAVPLHRLIDAGAQVALGADDPLLFGHRLLDQYVSARVDHGFDDQQLAELARSSVLASRAPDPVKAQLAAEIATWSGAPDRAR
ncbi:MAG: adenosine deaminase [Micrococcales bacterium]|nr:MAG: adenosine deaminase [Micrococcales bacterium]PIE26233.1 MAG: adenosine deaminase [Micrococcales bacterium]